MQYKSVVVVVEEKEGKKKKKKKGEQSSMCAARDKEKWVFIVGRCRYASFAYVKTV